MGLGAAGGTGPGGSSSQGSSNSGGGRSSGPDGNNASEYSGGWEAQVREGYGQHVQDTYGHPVDMSREGILNKTGYYDGSFKSTILSAVGRLLDTLSLANPLTALGNLATRAFTDKSLGKHLVEKVKDAIVAGYEPEEAAALVAGKEAGASPEEIAALKMDMAKVPQPSDQSQAYVEEFIAGSGLENQSGQSYQQETDRRLSSVPMIGQTSLASKLPDTWDSFIDKQYPQDGPPAPPTGATGASNSQGMVQQGTSSSGPYEGGYRGKFNELLDSALNKEPIGIKFGNFQTEFKPRDKYVELLAPLAQNENYTSALERMQTERLKYNKNAAKDAQEGNWMSAVSDTLNLANAAKSLFG